MKVKVLVALTALLVTGSAEARTRSANARHRARPRITVRQIRSAIAGGAWVSGAAATTIAVPPAPQPARRSALAALLPPGVLAVLVEAATRRDAPPSSTDGLSWRDLRPQDESGKRIVPLAMGRF